MAAIALQHPLDRFHGSTFAGARNLSCLCKRRKGATSICKQISHEPREIRGITYVFHAPDTNITT